MDVYMFPPGTFKAGMKVNRTKNGAEIKTADKVAASGVILAANVSRILVTSDATPGECHFSVPDIDTSYFQDGESAESDRQMVAPEIGYEIAIFSSDAGILSEDESDVEYHIIFKGVINDVTKSSDENGSFYTAICNDMKIRLMDEVIFKEYNVQSDIASKPNFSEKDILTTPLHDNRWTVQQIVEDILDVAYSQQIDVDEKYSPVIYFRKEDFIYSSSVNVSEYQDHLGETVASKTFNEAKYTSSEKKLASLGPLNSFVPERVSLSNSTVLDSIYNVISKAGAYRMVYNPENDKIVFTQLTKSADCSGDEIVLRMPTMDKDDPNKEYADEVDVISDNTIRKASDIANVFRMIMDSRISWYSGHFYISSGNRDGTDTSKDANINSDSKYFMNNYNWDGYKYHFSPINLSDNNNKFSPYMIVGCPLYPQWNPSEGYLPVRVNISTENTRKIPSDWFPTDALPITDKIYDYGGAKSFEYEGITVLDKAFPADRAFATVSGDSDFKVALGHTYEAWFPWPGFCKYCLGSGAVDSIPGDWKTNFEVWFGDSRNIDGSKSRTDMVPFNYNYIQTVVGKDADGSDIIEQIPQNHPLPWKNMCLACRGTGYEPMFKIRNIEPNVMELPPDKSAMSVEAKKAATDRTWAAMAKEYTDIYPVQIQVESTYMAQDKAVVKFTDVNGVVHPLAGQLKNICSNAADKFIFPEEEKLLSMYRTQLSSSNDSYVIDPIRGNVIFSKRQAVLCEKRLRMIKKHSHNVSGEQKRYYILYGLKEELGTTAYEKNAFTFRQPSYWRPARAWITCYFTREKFYDNLKSSATINPKSVTLSFNGDQKAASGSTEDDTKGTYQIGARIWDGRSVLEIKETANDKDKSEFNVRPVVRSELTSDLKWQMYPLDILKMPVPATDENAWLPANDPNFPKTVLAKAIEAKYWFPQGAINVYEPFTQHEMDNAMVWIEKKVDGKMSFVRQKLSPEDVNRQTPQPKQKAWAHSDDRYKMAIKAAKELERRNDIQVTGNIVIRGRHIPLEKGMGYVTLGKSGGLVPTWSVKAEEAMKKIKACVVKIEYNFGGSFTTMLEVGTEELRLGDIKEEDKDSRRRLENKVSEMYNKALRQKSIAGGAQGTSTTDVAGATPGQAMIHTG